MKKSWKRSLKRYIAENNINFYTINAVKIAQEIGLGGRINMIMQSVFFKLANIIPVEDAIRYLKEAVVTSYGKKGEKVVNMNFAAIDAGINSVKKINVPDSWKDAKDKEEKTEKHLTDFYREICDPINKLQGNKLAVSKFVETGAGDTFESGTTRFEKRGIAVNVPEWIPENCIQCNQCSFVCPHATIRAFLLNEDEREHAPKDFKVLNAKGVKDPELKYFTIGVSPLDCVGCGNCAEICPAPGKALIMKPQQTQHDQIEPWNYATDKVKNKANPMKKAS